MLVSGPVVHIILYEIISCLFTLKSKKAPGHDRVKLEFFKNGSIELQTALTKVINNVSEGRDPTWSNISMILPFLKKGPAEDVNNYRSISLIDSLSKILSAILNNRLIKWVTTHNKLKENQADFRSGYSTIDNLYSFDFLINYMWYKGHQKVYCLFVDFKSAFDCVNRSSLLYKLNSLGVSTKFIHKLEVLYNNTTNMVWNGVDVSEEFETKTGVKQGCYYYI
jgi:sorting nexin-29